MNNDEYIETLEDEKNDLEKQVDKLEGQVNSQEEELEEAKEKISKLEEHIEEIYDMIVKEIEEAAGQEGFHWEMGANLFVIDDGPPGYYEKSQHEIFNHQTLSDQERHRLDTLENIYSLSPKMISATIRKKTEEGREEAKKEIEEMKNSSDTYTRKLAGGK